MRRKLILVSMLFAIFFANMMPFVIHVSAEQTTKLLMDPPSIIDESLTPCNNITLTVQISDVTNLFGYEFGIYYRNTVLIAVEAVRPPGHFLEPTDPFGQFVAKWELKNDFNATHGRIWLAFTLLAPETARSGSGTLAEITFHIESVSSTSITLKDTKLADDTGSPISHVVESGYFSNSPPPPPPPPAQIIVEPAKLVDPALGPCENFTININILNATDVYAFEFQLGYDASVIHALEIQEGSFLKSAGSTSILGTEINNTEGYIWFAVTLLSPPGVNGNGTLATITFHVIDMGATLFTLYETSLTDQTGESLPHTTADGYFANIVFAKLFIDPPEIIDPSILPGDIFSIDIKIENIQDLYGYEFHLNYTTEVLTCIGVNIYPILNETSFTTNFSVDDGIGDVFANVTYYPPANPISTIPPVSLVTLTFKVDTMGTSNLTLYNTELVDPLGDPIPHETEDGFFQSVIRDIAVIHVNPSMTTVYEGWTVNITVIVKNEGDLSETFDVTAFYDNTTIDTLTVNDLASGENTTIIFEWNTHGLFPCQNYTLRAEAEPVPYETDLSDNIYFDGAVKIKLVGDINGDGIVDIFDLAAAALAFSSSPGDPNWNPDTDLDQNGIIDIFDIVRITMNYGRTC